MATLIVGSGFAGIAMGRQLLVDGDDDFLILERASGIGGTWRDNIYPGCACDVPSHLYSYSFALNPEWSRVHATQPEILAYMERVAEESGVIGHVRLNADVLAAAWDDDAEEWLVDTTRGRFVARNLITASGHLSDPKLPELEGLATFRGELFHSARWNPDADFKGKRIGVVGTGASAVQIVPEIAKVASQLTVFQRSAPWIRPRAEREYTVAERRMFARAPETLLQIRADMYWGAEALFLEKRLDLSLIDTAEQTALAHLADQIHDPELLEKLTPDYRFGCKRTLRSNDYYPAFLRPNVSLVTDAITRVTEVGLTTMDGSLHELDVIIFATGFEAADMPIAHRIRGRGGELLADHWSGGEQALAGLSVHGFPNMFVLNGPNSSIVASIIFMIECQVSYASGALRYAREHGVRWMEATQEAEDAFGADIDRRAESTVWLKGDCDNWYVDERSGRLTALWPDFARRFLIENSHFSPHGYEVSHRSVERV
ncbi:NAD(P)/FAD-dependent oxidoreductase [Microbacterium sp. SYP-A9085]|uniref:flavin-containing monooxygenase n=1 Tax=Microbacterium sp. SYP-A9085 TaxID=2664454 RepID=UPI001C12C597